MEILLILLGTVLLFVLAFFYGAFSWGLVGFKFWYWFLLPLFPALPAITLFHAIGLMCVVGLFKNIPAQIIKDEYVKKTDAQIMAVIAPWLTLLGGWIIKAILL